MKRIFLFLVCLTVVLILVACRSPSDSLKPKEGQPAFPPLGQYWVIDNGCHFRQETVETADATFEQLRQDRIAEVVVICQTGVVNRGSLNDELIWTRDWGRWAGLGDKEDERAMIWLIRPDVPPEEDRVTIEVSLWLYWYTASDYTSVLDEAANYANWDDFDGVLESIARNTDTKLRELVEKRGSAE